MADLVQHLTAPAQARAEFQIVPVVVYAVAIPLLLAFSVARYQTAPAVRP